MTVSISSHRRRLIICLLILISINSTAVLSQKSLSGNLNQPKSHVVTIGLDRVTVDDITGFNKGDTILLIQMQGVKITIAPVYGSLQDKYGEPGMHEFLIISAVNVVPKEIVFSRNILKIYDFRGNIQIVRVPYYNSVIITGTLSCDPWNQVTKSGGVLALIVGRRLNLKANIDVSGKGFKGGNDAVGEGICYSVNAGLYGNSYYNSSFLNAGFKGEGIANFTEFNQPLDPAYMKGLGANWNGGGGGNAKFSGGGGGSNLGAGGIGGSEYCFPPVNGAAGGAIAGHPLIPNRIYFGGGGGASTSLTGLSPSGGNGGGVVIIVTDTIIGSGGKILSNGGNGGRAVIDGGSGGGGGGGSIALSSNSYGSTPLEFSVLGGNGGDNPGNFGEGGGGGGGLLYISTNTTGNVSFYINGGLPGNNPASTALSGGAGGKKTGFNAILNGFLFNSIRSVITGDTIDYVCSNMLPPKITGTKPVGGTAPYTYIWEKSYDQIIWTLLTNNTDPKDYSPTVNESATVFFRRTIIDSSIPSNLTDYSKVVKIVVQPFIKNNIIGTSDTICFAQDPPAFSSKATLQDGNGIYAFNWEVSLNNSLFNLPANANISEGYIPPPALKITSWYRRTVTSGRCIDSTAIVKITVIDTVQNNKILNYPTDICFGMTFTNLLATTTLTFPALGGGDNIYSIKWESKINGTGWGPAPGVSNADGYNPGELPQRVPFNEYYFRRVVYSGSNDVCVNTSNIVLLKDFPVLINNTITSNQTICSGVTPAKLIGSTPLNGNGVYNYAWQDSTKSHIWTDISGAVSIDYQPPVLTDTTRYRRIVSSSACSDISKSIIVNVHKPITNYNISLLAAGFSDTTICSGQTPHLLIGTAATGGTTISGGYSYQWKFSLNNTNFTSVSVGGTGLTYQPPALTINTYYKREVISGACTELSNSISVTVLSLISNNTISVNQTICFNSAPVALSGTAPLGGAGVGTYTYYWEQSTDNGTTWTGAAGTNNSASGGYSPPALNIPMKYRRTVTSGLSGCCTHISNIIDISIYPPLPTGKITNIADTIICGDSQVLLKIELTGAAPWKVTYRENSVDGPVTPVSGNKVTLPVNPASPVALNSFTYLISKVEDKNGCSATSLSGTKKATVYRVPSANGGPDQIVCGPIVTLTATPSVGSGLWYYPGAVVGSTINKPTVTLTIDSTFAGANISHKFYWEETNWQCKNKDSVNVSFDKRISSINAGPDTSLYSFDNIYHMVASPVQKWEEGFWSPPLRGSGDFSINSDNRAVVANLSKGVNTFLWTIRNGECKREDQVTVNVNNLEIPQGFSPNNDPGGYNNTFVVRGLDLPNQTAELKIVNGAGAEVFTTTNRDGEIWTDWDGKNSNGFDLPEGTYYYLLKIISNGNKQIFRKSGFIILKRY